MTVLHVQYHYFNQFLIMNRTNTVYPQASCTFYILNRSSLWFTDDFLLLFTATDTLISLLPALIHNNHNCGHCFKTLSFNWQLKVKDRRHCGNILAIFCFSFLALPLICSSALSLPCHELTSRKSTSVSSVFVGPENSSVDLAALMEGWHAFYVSRNAKRGWKGAYQKDCAS